MCVCIGCAIGKPVTVSASCIHIHEDETGHNGALQMQRQRGTAAYGARQQFPQSLCEKT